MESFLKGNLVKFDPTISLGHLLTFVGFIVAIFTAWVNLDKRVIILEENRSKQAIIDKHQDLLIETRVDQLREMLNESKKSLDRIANSLEARK
jgi:hypothetical protein